MTKNLEAFQIISGEEYMGVSLHEAYSLNCFQSKGSTTCLFNVVDLMQVELPLLRLQTNLFFLDCNKL